MAVWHKTWRRHYVELPPGGHDESEWPSAFTYNGTGYELLALYYRDEDTIIERALYVRDAHGAPDYVLIEPGT